MARVVRFGWAVPLALSVLFGACAEPPGAERIVGPDGSRMLHVHCGAEQVACFQLAGERCPYGYDLSPILDPHDGNFLVRCHNPIEGGGFANSGAPGAAAAPIASVRPRPPSDGWPPPEVAKPSEPWPAPSVATPPAPPTPRTASGEVDVGY